MFSTLLFLPPFSAISQKTSLLLRLSSIRYSANPTDPVQPSSSSFQLLLLLLCVAPVHGKTWSSFPHVKNHAHAFVGRGFFVRPSVRHVANTQHTSAAHPCIGSFSPILTKVAAAAACISTIVPRMGLPDYLLKRSLRLKNSLLSLSPGERCKYFGSLSYRTAS